VGCDHRVPYLPSTERRNEMTKQDKIQQDITFAQNRLNAKLAALPKLLVSDLSDEMKRKYLDGIAHERALIARFTALARS
jgi:hypothetical protein